MLLIAYCQEKSYKRPGEAVGSARLDTILFEGKGEGEIHSGHDSAGWSGGCTPTLNIFK